MTDSHDIPHVPAGVEVVPILDFGSQFVQLIARRVREAGAFSILLAPDTPVEVLQALRPKGIILSGGPSSVDGENAPTCDPRILDMGVPVLGAPAPARSSIAQLQTRSPQLLGWDCFQIQLLDELFDTVGREKASNFHLR